MLNYIMCFLRKYVSVDYYNIIILYFEQWVILQILSIRQQS